jgi:hypothetical protein
MTTVPELENAIRAAVWTLKELERAAGYTEKQSHLRSRAERRKGQRLTTTKR